MQKSRKCFERQLMQESHMCSEKLMAMLRVLSKSCLPLPGMVQN